MEHVWSLQNVNLIIFYLRGLLVDTHYTHFVTKTIFVRVNKLGCVFYCFLFIVYENGFFFRIGHMSMQTMR